MLNMLSWAQNQHGEEHFPETYTFEDLNVPFWEEEGLLANYYDGQTREDAAAHEKKALVRYLMTKYNGQPHERGDGGTPESRFCDPHSDGSGSVQTCPRMIQHDLEIVGGAN
jgi:hypothetical protein